ncbi:2-oxoglutarate and iron-dependent oxygenase JMJD4-like [Convolutriloba macropyga]|uniref:2-oxoglutarate and iron-dependent oxygenase JMJD4-like n=1 Tax=Convolutriloba macropyga TaxID=536237 RepID=UPI003F52598B
MFFDSYTSPEKFEEIVRTGEQPCKFGAWISQDWPCFQNWFDDKTLNFNNFLAQFGDVEVPIISCHPGLSYEASKSKSLLSQLIDDLKRGPSNKYLKDWHFCDHLEEESDVFSVPEIFKCDWLNDCLIKNKKQDYRFLYLGGSETWTPFHVDVFCSYSWSVNITGHKTWLFVSSKHMTEQEKANPPTDLRSCDHLMKNAIEIEQGPGEAIFVPSTWFHQVYNRGLTLSINHNWFNGYNIKHVFDLLKSDLDLVKQEIEFLKDAMGDEYADHCQVLLRANSGFNFYELKDVLSYAASNDLYDEFQRNQAQSYLEKVEKVLEHGKN